MLRALFVLALLVAFPACSTFERNPRDFKRVAGEQNLVRSLSPSASAELVFGRLKAYATRCFKVSGSVTRQEGTDSVTIINEQRAQIRTLSEHPFHAEILVRWYTKPYEPVDDGNIFFLAEVREAPGPRTSLRFFGNRIFDSAKYFDGFAAAAGAKPVAYCPGE